MTKKGREKQKTVKKKAFQARWPCDEWRISNCWPSRFEVPNSFYLFFFSNLFFLSAQNSHWSLDFVVGSIFAGFVFSFFLYFFFFGATGTNGSTVGFDYFSFSFLNVFFLFFKNGIRVASWMFFFIWFLRKKKKHLRKWPNRIDRFVRCQRPCRGVVGYLCYLFLKGHLFLWTNGCASTDNVSEIHSK